MKNMTTDVSALNNLEISHYGYDDFTSSLMEKTFNSLEKLAGELRNAKEMSTNQELEIRHLFLAAKVCLDIDTEHNVMTSSFYYGRVNQIMVDYAEKGFRGIVEYFHPAPVVRSPEEEEQYQKSILSLLGI